MSHEYPKLAIEAYVSDCARLRNDLQKLIKDKNLPNPVHYAVDFSEIHGYVLPGSARQFRLFSDDDEVSAAQLSVAALHLIFFHSDEKLVLLPPYALELQTFASKLHSHATVDLADAAATVDVILPSILDDDRFDLLERISRGYSATNHENEEVAKFFEDKAGALLRVVEGTHIVPLRRLNALLRAKRIVGLSSLRNQIIEPDQETFDCWFDRLTHLRKDKPAATNRLDALAMASIAAFNTTSVDGAQIVLLTRSEHMHSVASELNQEDLVRHPRVFVAFRRGDDVGREAQRRSLSTLRDSLDAFLEAHNAARDNDLVPLAESSVKLRERIDQVKRQWRSYARLAAATLHGYMRPTGGTLSSRRLAAVLRVVNNDTEIRELLLERIRNLAAEIESSHQLLGLALQDQANADRIVGSEVVATSRVANVNLSATFSMPYSLEFYSERLQPWSRLFAEKRTLVWADLLTFFSEQVQTRGDYELLLAMAYLFAVLNRWEVAEKYCALSLDYATKKDFPHEGKFLLAICQRKLTPRLRRLLGAYELLHQAGQLKRDRLGSTSYEDPRFLKEEATLIFLWNEKANEAPDAIDFTPPPAVKDALELSRKVLKNPEADNNLRCQVHNNLCYYLTETGILDEAERYHHELKEFFRSEPAPPLVRDTIAWFEWKRYRQNPEEILRELRDVVGHSDLTFEDRRRIRKHITEIVNSSSSFN